MRTGLLGQPKKKKQVQQKENENRRRVEERGREMQAEKKSFSTFPFISLFARIWCMHRVDKSLSAAFPAAAAASGF